MDYEVLTELIVELELDDIVDAVKEALEVDKKDPFDVLASLTAGMDEVGRRYDEEIYYLADLMLAAETMKVALEVLKPELASSEKVKEKAKIIRHHASSIATTPSRVLVRLPLALYSRITIKVAAGAVAEDMAPKRNAVDKCCLNKKYTPMVTKMDGKRAAAIEI